MLIANFLWEVPLPMDWGDGPRNSWEGGKFQAFINASQALPFLRGSTSPTSANFGKVQSKGDQRGMQIALRYPF